MRVMITRAGTTFAAMMLASTSTVALAEAAPANAAADQTAQAGDANDAPSNREIIVTGVFGSRAIENAPISINVVSAQQLAQHAAVSAADLLKNIPGVFVNSSLGEIRNVVFSRGISANSLDAASGYYYVSLQEDGLPVELATANNFGPDYFLRPDLNLARVEGLRGGTAAITGPNAPGGIFNYISRTGKSNPGMEVQIKGGLLGDLANPYYRGDVYLGGKLNDSGLYYSIGGFYRWDRGSRDPGYAMNKGGQIHGNILYDYANGSLMFTAKYLDDHNAWNEFTPAIGATRIAPGFSKTSSVLPPANAAHCFPNADGREECWDPTRLVHSRSAAFGLKWNHEFGEGWKFENNARYTSSKADWNTGALISASPMTDVVTSFINTNAFLPAGTINYFFKNSGQLATSNLVIPTPFGFSVQAITQNNLPNQNLLAGGIFTQVAFAQHYKSENFVDQATLTKDWGNHHLALGGYVALSKLRLHQGGGGIGFSTLTPRPEMLTATFTDTTGKVFQLTDPTGFQALGTVGGNDYSGTQHQYSVFFGDTWKVTPELTLDAGGRWTGARLRFDLADRRQAFQAFGLPAPRQTGPGELVLEQDAARLVATLAGPGLSIVLEQDGSAASRLTLQAEGPGQILPEGAARLLPDGLVDAHARLAFRPDAVTLDEAVFNLAGATARGTLALAREGGRLTGRLALPSIDLRGLLGAALGAAPSGAATWSTARFGPPASLPEFDLAIEAGAVTAADGIILRGARFALRADQDGLRLDDLTAPFGGGRVGGRFATRREGGLAQLSGRVTLEGVDLAPLTGGGLGGKVSGQVEAGGSGESPARLIAGLGGAGALTFAEARLGRFDPAAYARIIATTGEDASESDAARLQQRLSEALDRDGWSLGSVTVPFTLAGGLVRLQPLTFERSGLRTEASGIVDLRALTLDLRLGLKPLGALPKGWPADAPQVGVAWRGPLAAPRRETDVNALSNMVAARALAREIERVEAFEADARERAAHSRRLRAEREMRENARKLAEFLKAEEERRLAEEKRAEEERRAEEARRLAEERRAEEQRRAEQARMEQEMRRRIEAEERAERARAAAERAAAERAAAERAATPQPQPGPLILPGAPRASFPDPVLQPAPPLAPPVDIQSVPRPLSRGAQPN